MWVARQGSDAKCALWAVQTVLQEVIDLDVFFDLGAQEAAAEDAQDANGPSLLQHGQGGSWSLSAVVRGLARTERFVMRAIGERRGLEAFAPDVESARPVRGIVVQAFEHYTARVLCDGAAVLKLDSLHPDACVDACRLQQPVPRIVPRGPLKSPLFVGRGLRGEAAEN